MADVLPDPEQWSELTPAPGSPVWRAFNDARMLSTALYALLLQVAHPTVGNGVHDYSSFTKDPWGRLLRTLDYVHGTIYGGPELAGTIGRRVRLMHRSIKGVTESGEHYTAMEPEAFAWVHATLAASIFAGREHFTRRPMAGAERQAFWDDWLRIGRFIGVRERDLPADVNDFDRYLHEMIADRLTYTPAIPEVMASVSHAVPPEIPGLTPRVWRMLATPAGGHLRAITSALLDDRLRERLHLTVTRTDRAVFTAHCAVARRSEPLLRAMLPEFGTTYVRWRRDALARGEVAGGAVQRQEAAAA
jgi:uncharacterized protein (DUF2236 family)